MPLEHEFFSPEQIAALYNLAKERGIPVDSMRFNEVIDYLYENEYTSIRMLLFSSAVFFPYRPQVDDNEPTLLFDGKSLQWRQGEHIVISWPAYSGAEEYFTAEDYSIEAQKKRDEGPIPAGWYRVPQDRYQERPNDMWERIKNSLGGGSWRGGKRSWGNHRIWLEPEAGTNTYGRSGLTIHGGDEPGSRGCIDLVQNMESFARWFTAYGKDMRLEVAYPKK